MRHVGPLVLSIAASVALSACQSSQSRQEQLATICAVPVNREPGSAYWGECQSLYPSTTRQLQNNYLTGAPGF